MVIDLTYFLFAKIDYFGIVRGWFSRINSFYWYFARLPSLRMVPRWAWYLFYFYLVIIPHIVFIIMLYKVTYDTFIGEPRQRRLEIKKAKERELEALKEFDRLYESGGKSCPVLRAAKSNSREYAALIMEQCPIAQKYEAPKSLKMGRNDDGTYNNYKKYD